MHPQPLGAGDQELGNRVKKQGFCVCVEEDRLECRQRVLFDCLHRTKDIDEEVTAMNCKISGMFVFLSKDVETYTWIKCEPVVTKRAFSALLRKQSVCSIERMEKY